MNKQELIDELTKYVKRYEDEMDEYDQGRFVAYKVALALTRKLDEPKKTVVPKCAEPFLKEAKCSTDVIQLFVDIVHVTRFDGFIWEWSTDFYDWLAKDSDTLYILCDALRYGYEVEKEQLYIMPVPHVSFSVHYCVEDNHISFRQGNAQKFTQTELDKYFPDIKQFAQPAEEVVEG